MIMAATECSASVHFGRKLHESSCCALSPFEFVLAVLSVSLLHNEPVSVGVVCELLAIMQRWNSHDNFGSGVDCCSSPLSATLPRNLAVVDIDIGFFFTTSPLSTASFEAVEQRDVEGNGISNKPPLQILSQSL